MIKDMANKVSDNIRKLRQKKGMSQDRLSKEADLALNTIVKIETGENPNPTVETLEKIAKALGVSVADLFKD
jgi:transcriptional regulator with XRE-family HTH domain